MADPIQRVLTLPGRDLSGRRGYSAVFGCLLASEMIE